MNSKRKATVTILSIATIVIGAVVSIWLFVDMPTSDIAGQSAVVSKVRSKEQPESSPSGSEVNGRSEVIEDDVEAELNRDGLLPGNGQGDEPELTANESPGISRQKSAFAGDLPILEALKTGAIEGALDYDDLVKNLALWQPVCSTSRSQLAERGLLDESDGARAVEKRMDVFCQEFPANLDEELKEYLTVQVQETATGVGDWSSRLRSIEDLGAEVALESAISDLALALDSGNYAEVADIVWFLGFSGHLEGQRNDDKFVPGAFGNRNVLIAVGASLYCIRLGGCSGHHPVTMGLCLLLSDRKCAAPRNIQHAVEQLLTGYELGLFYRVHEAILSRLSSHRA